MTTTISQCRIDDEQLTKPDKAIPIMMNSIFLNSMVKLKKKLLKILPINSNEELLEYVSHFPSVKPQMLFDIDSYEDLLAIELLVLRDHNELPSSTNTEHKCRGAYLILGLATEAYIQSLQKNLQLPFEQPDFSNFLVDNFHNYKNIELKGLNTIQPLQDKNKEKSSSSTSLPLKIEHGNLEKYSFRSEQNSLNSIKSFSIDQLVNQAENDHSFEEYDKLKTNMAVITTQIIKKNEIIEDPKISVQEHQFVYKSPSSNDLRKSSEEVDRTSCQSVEIKKKINFPNRFINFFRRRLTKSH
ncbi:hypothetical protein SNEBB_004153 [Seison nebaliae]|nr:hypothetical protein SNEBB_004153 [Seison nebaliae]